MPLHKDDFEKFMALLDPEADTKTEDACAEYLDHREVVDYLCKTTPTRVLTVRHQEIMTVGRSDFYVVGEFMNGAGKLKRRVFFWELKAPQCFWLERDDSNNRLRPTKDLLKAQTQLLHYVNEARGSESFLKKHGVNRDDIQTGGIIIGRDQRAWKSHPALSKPDAEVSLDLWMDFYRNAGIEIHTWDRIATLLDPAT